MNRQTPYSKRSPSILVTDVRHQKAHSAPFVQRRVNNVSVDSLLSNTSEVPSAQRRHVPQRILRSRESTSNYGSTARRSRMAPGARRTGPDSGQDESASDSRVSESERSPLIAHNREHGAKLKPIAGSEQTPPRQAAVKPVPQLSKSLPSRTSKQSQRLVLIPEAEDGKPAPTTSTRDEYEEPVGETARVTSYLIAEGLQLTRAAEYLKTQHRARVRLYDEALFADYLLPLLPGNGVDYRIQSSLGDNRTMERLIDISEQRDHHYEYFSAIENDRDESSKDDEDFDPSEPQDFSPRPSDAPIAHTQSSSNGETGHQNDEDRSQHSNRSSTASAAANSSSDTLKNESDAQAKHQKYENEQRIERYMSHAEMFVFNYGVVVFWNFTEAQEKQILADLSIGSEELVIHSYNDQEIESEELRFNYAQSDQEKPRIFNDVITLNNNSHMIKLAMSHAMAQSTILCSFEERMHAHLKDVRGVPKTLALTGKLGMNREQLLKISGRLFKLRVDVNLSSNVLDIPEFFWDSEPSLFPLFNALRDYLEIDERVLVLNERQSVFLELTSILGDSIAEFNMDRITIIVIWLIVLSICVSLTEIAMRYLILHKTG